MCMYGITADMYGITAASTSYIRASSAATCGIDLPLIMRSPTAVALVCLGLVHGSVHPRPAVLPRASTLRVTTTSSSRRAILAAATATRCVERSCPQASATSPSSAPRQRQIKRRAAFSVGQPRPIGRCALAGRPHRARFPTQAAAAATCAAPPAAHAEKAKEVLLANSASGLKWGDIRPGVGNVPATGQTVTIDYMMTKRAGAPRRSTLAPALAQALAQAQAQAQALALALALALTPTPSLTRRRLPHLRAAPLPRGGGGAGRCT
jgi:hypothetical protein